MNAYPVTFKLADGTPVAGELVTAVSLPTVFWTLQPAPDSQEYSAYPTGVLPAPPSPPAVPAVWSNVPNVLQQSAAYSVNVLTSYLNPSTGVTVTLVNGPLPAGWAFDGTHLTYDGATVDGSADIGLQFQAVVTATGATSLSNSFAVQGIGAAPTDVTAPPPPTGLVVTPATTGLNVAFTPTSDPYCGGAWSGVSSYEIQRAVDGGSFSNLTSVSAADAGLEFYGPAQDIGAPSTPGSTAVAGAQYTMSGYGLQMYGTSDQGQLGGWMALTGNFDVTFRVVSCVNASSIYGKCGVDARSVIPSDAVNGPGSPHVFANVKAIAGGVGYGMDYRATQNGATSDIANVANAAANLWVRFNRTGNVFTMWASTNENLLGTASALVGSVTQTMPSTLYVTPACAGVNGAATSCVIDNWNVTQDAQIVYNDTSATGSHSYAYQANAKDVAGNVSAYGPQTNYTANNPVSPSSSLLSFLKNPGGLISGHHFNVFAATGGADPYGGTMSQFLHNGAASTCTVNDLKNGDTGKMVALLDIQVNGPCSRAQSIRLGQDWQNAGGILRVTWLPPNPSLGTATLAGANPFPGLITPGNAIYNTFHRGTMPTGGYTGSTQAQPNVQDFANIIKQFPKTVIVRFCHEFNVTGEWWFCPGNGSTAANYQALYKQFVLDMDSLGVTNVIYEVCLNWNGNESGSWSPYIPLGDSQRSHYFDVISFDYYYAQASGYSSPAHDPGPDLNGAFSSKLQSYGVPILMGETGIISPGGTGNPYPPTGAGDNSIYGASFHAECPWLAAICFWCQGWALNNQYGAGALLSQTITRDKLPVLT